MSRFLLLGVAPYDGPENHSADEGRNEARSTEPRCQPVAEGSPGGGNHLTPRARDQVSAAGMYEYCPDEKAGGDAADDSEADLLQQEGCCAAASCDVRFNVGERNGGEQEWNADPIVEPALDIQSLANPARDSRLGDDRLAKRRVRRRQDHRQDQRLAERQLIEDHRGGYGPESDGQRQADAQQTRRHRDLAPQLAEVDTGCVGEQDQGKGGLGQHSHGRAGA